MRLIRRLTSASPLAISLLLATATVLLPSTALATNGAGRLSEEEAVRAARELARWLAADREDGNLIRVTRYKQAIVADLIGALEKGAASDQLELVRREAEESYRELKKHRWEVLSTMEVYVKRDVDNFAAEYRARAAQALAAIRRRRRPQRPGSHPGEGQAWRNPDPRRCPAGDRVVPEQDEVGGRRAAAGVRAVRRAGRQCAGSRSSGRMSSSA